MNLPTLDNIGHWTLAFAIIGTVCYLSIAGKIDPSVAVSTAGVVLGYYFGKKGGIPT